MTSLEIDRSWMMAHRKTTKYIAGVKDFLEFARSNSKGSNTIRCPCTECVNLYKHSFEVVESHLIAFGIDKRYRVCNRHGEAFFIHDEDANASREGVNYPNNQYDETPNDAIDMVELVEAVHAEMPIDPEKVAELLSDAEKPIYPGCSRFTKLSTLVRLFDIKATNGWFDKSFTDLLSLLKKLLPDDNEMVESMYEAKKTLSTLGLDNEKIHACPNDCILYWEEHKDKTVCPTCGTSRWKTSKFTSKLMPGVPSKVSWYFSPIPRFKRMYQSVETSKELIWHAHEREQDGFLRHPSDSPAWKLVDHKWPEFSKDPRNLRIALSTDGINPHSTLSGKHSCWPVLIVIYNLPPWLCMKRKYMMLSLLISGPKQPGQDIDVYLAPLIRDLKLLWEEGVEAFDAYRREFFTLKAVLLWTINDFPAYGVLCGCKVKGYNACPICIEGTQSSRLKHSKKILCGCKEVCSDKFERFYTQACMKSLLKENGISMVLAPEVFGCQDDFEFKLTLEDIKGICKCKGVSINSINLYIRLLYEKLKTEKKQQQFAFLNPVSIWKKKIDVITSEILRRLLDIKVDYLFIPFCQSSHWMLMLVNNKVMKIYWMNPKGEDDVPMPALQTVMASAGQGLFIDGKRRNKPTWGYPSVPKQKETWESGYFVMRYMKEIIQGQANKIPTGKVFKKVFTKRDIDEVREEWVNGVEEYL